jgi:sigma-B regulation protein RsbU (phosphoserine phosphatase)
MPRFTSLPRPVLLVLATLLAASMLFYSALWMYYIRWQPRIYLGIDPGRLPQTGAWVIANVGPKSPAAQAGLQTGDRILSIDGRRTDTLFPYYDVLRHGCAENPVRVTVERPGASGPLVLPFELHAEPVTPNKLTWLDFFSNQLITSFPLWFLIVSLPVLFLRLQDRNAWLMALLFASTIAGGPLLVLEPLMEPRLDHFAAAYKIIFAGIWAPVFSYFFSVFPVRSFLDRRVPWLKTALLAMALLVTVPLAAWALFTSASQPLLRLAAALSMGQWRNVVILVLADFLLPGALGTVSLIGNGFFSDSREVRRKIRVIVWGTLVGLLPGLLVYSLPAYLGRGTQSFPPWLWGLISLFSFWLFPLSFAYAVVKHRVMEIPLLLKRSARYLLVQRGFVVVHVLFSMALTVALILLVTRSFKPTALFSSPALLAGAAVFGSVLALSGIRLHRAVTQRIDRAFFRGAYNARQVLEELADHIRQTTDAEHLAALLASEFTKALHPLFVTVYLEGQDGLFHPKAAEGPLLSADLPLLQELARRAAPIDVSLPDGDSNAATLAMFGPTPPECLVPILGVNRKMLGFVALGARLSDEPYSGEDKRLLASVASQAGFALESMRLAGQMAERMDAERRAAQEMHIAKQVQARLFPQTLPALASLDYTGGCVQARQVGGDYFDFLDLGRGRLGIVLADIAGKGISGALLMANLQANLRSQSAVAAQDLARFLTSVNQLFYANTSEESYATLFFADYEEPTRRLRYANCGHNPPLLLRANGTLERFTATTTIVGAFSRWDCPIREVALAPGDVLLLYTDGITEARNQADDEFGDQRLAALLRELRGQSAQATLDAIFSAVQRYSAGEQGDDLTLVVLRVLS